MRNQLAWLAMFMLATPAIAQTIPTHQGWLADEASLLSSSEEEQLRSHSRVGDYQVCILTMPSTIGSESKDVAVNTLNTWNPGQNSVLVLVSLNPRKLYLQPGTALKHVFTEEVASRICKEVIKPHLSQGRNFQGLQAGVDAIRLTIYPVEAATVVASDTTGSKIWLAAKWTLACGIFLLVIGLLLAKAGVYPFYSTPKYYDSTSLAKHSLEDAPAPKLIENTFQFPTPTAPVKQSAPTPQKVTKKAAKKTGTHRSTSYTPPATPKSKPSSTSYDEPSSSCYEAPSSSYEPYHYDSSSSSSYDSGSSFSCDSGGGGGSDF